MTIEDQIAALLAEAEPLRALPEDEAEFHGLGNIVDEINRLRAAQALELHGALVPVAPTPYEFDPEAPVVFEKEVPALPAKRPGRPRKAEA